MKASLDPLQSIDDNDFNNYILFIIMHKYYIPLQSICSLGGSIYGHLKLEGPASAIRSRDLVKNVHRKLSRVGDPLSAKQKSPEKLPPIALDWHAS